MSASARPLLVIVGPTASGKSALALALAERLDGELISADSVQLYRGFDLGSNKPSAAERARVPHHLVDVVDPLDPMDAARWASLAGQAISEILARGRTPIVCGGSFLFVRALLWGFAPTPPGDAALRARHRQLVESEGRAALHAALQRVDPVTAERLAPNDVVRVSRALEVFELSGRPLSEWHAQHGFAHVLRPHRLIGLELGHAALARKIQKRTEQMLQRGLIEEVRGLLASGYAHARAMGAVGYRQVHEALALDPEPALEPLATAIDRATRIFARRQRTWLRDREVEWLAPDQIDAWLDRAAREEASAAASP